MTSPGVAATPGLWSPAAPQPTYLSSPKGLSTAVACLAIKCLPEGIAFNNAILWVMLIKAFPCGAQLYFPLPTAI